MARQPNYWINPATNEAFAWPVNHSTEKQFGKSRQMADGAPTDNIGLIPQQGSATPLILQWSGSIFTEAHLDLMLTMYELCETQSIYVQDFAANQYEVLITDFEVTRKGVAFNRHDPDNAPFWNWDYDLTMRVLTVRQGDWEYIHP